jgi:hypothetical protein
MHVNLPIVPLLNADRNRKNISQHFYCCVHRHWRRPRRKHRFEQVHWRAGRCLATAVLSLFPGHCLATGLYATIYKYAYHM